MPALPLDDAGPYVAGAYLVFIALILIYVAIMASKHASMRLRRLRRALAGDEAAGPLARTAAPTQL